VPAQKKRIYRREKLSVTRLKKHRHENGRLSWAKGGNKVYKHTFNLYTRGQKVAAGLVIRISVPEPCGHRFRTRGDR
jgi:hypothetical protein